MASKRERPAVFVKGGIVQWAFGLRRDFGCAQSDLTPLPLMNAPISALLDRKGRSVFSVLPSVTISEAVAEMNRQRVGCMLVIDEGGLVGVFTERDVLKRVVGAGVDPTRTRVAEVMTANVITVAPDATVEQAMVIFTEKRCRHLPVVEQGRLVGTISIGDITRWMADSSRAEAEHLKNYITTGFSTAPFAG